MLGVLRCLRDTIRRYGLTSQPLSQNAIAGTDTLKVPMSRKFFEGETIVIRNSTIGEMRTIHQIIDETTITLTENLAQTWPAAGGASEGCLVEKAPGGQYVKRIYLGDPDAIPDFPAITITADTRDEEWWTIGSTTAKWNCTISCIFEDDGLENSYENMLSLTKVVEDALWANRKPTFGQITESNLTVDLLKGSTSMVIDSTDSILPAHQAVLEDYAWTQYIEIDVVIDEHNLIFKLPAEFDFTVNRGAKIIVPSRWCMWTKPGSTTYGYIHKGTLLKASQISWFGQEEIIRLSTRVGATNL